ncbi:hypothetical protein [Sphingobium sp. WCS2017Hpa-17]|nr:hypothetical protein [Sphingobium sp. WCS2017Hpa-17]
MDWELAWGLLVSGVIPTVSMILSISAYISARRYAAAVDEKECDIDARS